MILLAAASFFEACWREKSSTEVFLCINCIMAEVFPALHAVLLFVLCIKFILWGASSPGSFSPISSGPGGASGAHTTLAERLSQVSCKFLAQLQEFAGTDSQHLLI